MAKLVLRNDKEPLYVMETTAEIKSQQRYTTKDYFKLHDNFSRKPLNIKIHDVLIIQDIENEVG